MALDSLSEHAPIIILVLAAFCAWACKRLVGKLEASIEDLAATVTQHERDHRRIHEDLYSLQKRTAEELHELIGEHKARKRTP